MASRPKRKKGQPNLPPPQQVYAPYIPPTITPADLNPAVPEIDLQITSTPVQATPRRLKAKWSADAADSLRDLWGLGPDNALDVFTEGLDDPNFDPNKPYHGKARASAEQELISKMASEMAAEIDKEILRDLGAL